MTALGGGAATHAMPGTAAAEADFPAPTAQADSGKAYLVSPPPPPAPCLAPRVALGRRRRRRLACRGGGPYLTCGAATDLSSRVGGLDT